MSDESISVEVRAAIHAALGDPARLAVVDMLRLGDASPGEIARALTLPTNLVAHHLKVLEGVGLLVRDRSQGDRRRTYVRLVPGTLARLLTPVYCAAPRVVFVCTHNSARSQLAAALWTRRSTVPVASAGTHPTQRVHTRAVRVARRHGLSLATARPTHLGNVLRDDDLVVAVCDSAHEEFTDHAQRLHWSIPDPAAADTDDAFEAAYADLAARIDRLAPCLSTSTPGADHE